MTKEKKPRKKSQKQLLIEALLIIEEGGKLNWGMEMRLIGKLLEKIPDVNFWFWFGSKHKYPTLMHLMSDMNSTNIVTKAHFDYTKQNTLTIKTPEAVKLEQEKVGEDTIITQKPKSLFEFLNS